MLKKMIFVLMVASASLIAQPMLPQQSLDSSQIYADKIVKADKPVLIDFWAAWCGPCRLLNPIIKELEKEYKDKIIFMKINTELHQKISAYFQISAIPAVFIVKDKVVVKAINGLREKEFYAKCLDDALALPSATTQKSTTGTK